MGREPTVNRSPYGIVGSSPTCGAKAHSKLLTCLNTGWKTLELEIKFNQEKHEKKKLYTEWYKLYNKHGYKKFCNLTGYDKSKPNLVTQFKRYVNEYKPQNGKKRGS